MPRAEVFFDEAAELKSDKCGEDFPRTRGGRAGAEDFIARFWFLEHIPDNEFDALEVAWSRVALGRFAWWYPERFEDMDRLGDEPGTEPDEKMTSKTVRIANAMRDAQKVAIVLACESRGDEGA